MDMFCRKYRETVSEEKVECRHTGDYCTFRSSCIVYFLSREDEDDRREEIEGPGKQDTSPRSP
jgi:hypothetical protein